MRPVRNPLGANPGGLGGWESGSPRLAAYRGSRVLASSVFRARSQEIAPRVFISEWTFHGSLAFVSDDPCQGENSPRPMHPGNGMMPNWIRFPLARFLALLALCGSDISSAVAWADEQPVISGRQSLRQLQSFALAHNPEVSAGTFDRQAAQARTLGAVGARLPRLSIEGGYNRYGPDLRLTAARYNGELGVFGNNILNADLVVRLPLYAGGRLVAEVRGAELLEASSGQRLARSRGDLVFNVASLYYGLLAQQRLIASLEFSEGALVAHLAQVQALIANRKAAAVDGLRSEVKLADTRQRLLRERNVMAIQRQSLLNLLGTGNAAADFSLADDLVVPPTESEGIETFVEVALRQRPDIVAARHELDAQRARLDVARAGRWPTVNLIGTVGQRSMIDPAQQPKGLSSNDQISRIGVTFEMPIFEGGRATARVDEEHAKLDALRQRMDKLLLQARLDVVSAGASLISALERLKSTEKAVELARKVTEIEREKYALGRGTQLEVLDAQNALIDTEATHIRALADANTAKAQLVWARGEAPQ